MRVAILAGGLGTRIQKEYPDTIKSLIEFGGVPFIFYQLHLLKQKDLTDIIICTGHGSEMLEEEIKRWKPFLWEYWKMKLSISNDGVKPLGTGGAIKKALPLLGNRFMVLYGDSYLDFDYGKTINQFIESGMDSLMTIYQNNNKFDKSNVAFDGKRIVLYNKKVDNPEYYRYIDYGANFFMRRAFNNTPIRFDLSWLQEKLIEERRMACDVIKERFYEIGSIEGIKEFRKMIGKKHV